MVDWLTASTFAAAIVLPLRATARENTGMSSHPASLSIFDFDLRNNAAPATPALQVSLLHQ